ncbi:hypothetical protein KTO58_01225 [Chitinophaga pendula]|uniref:hypothetical protein n=1 Tax=Chitinophaga TaxID=79328 RepID=UPI000BAEEA56|nr:MULTISPECIES: hypothetical protein [Chitinophaga]ASZ14516.1 hypothetical protein CK934_27995 [Chitinophaga sp. MD30]UCJ07827.1 hypothetical protein KTO58_01225 [Chitinophaga pendula]
MITIHDKPQTFTPAWNSVSYMISSDNYMQPDFKFVADVYSGGSLLGTLKYQAEPIGSAPVFVEIGRLIQSTVSANYCRLNTVVAPDVVVVAGGAVSAYSVQFGEQYSGTLHANLNSHSGYAFNGALNNMRFAFFDYTALQNTRFLTPLSRFVARKQDSVMLSVIQSDTAPIALFELKIYSATGVPVYTGTIPNPYTSLTAVNNRVLHLHVGFNHLATVLTLPLNVVSVAAYYTISMSGGGAVRIDLNSRCERIPSVRLHFLNELGGFDSFNFMLNSIRSIETERKSYYRQPSNRRTGYDPTERRFETLQRNYATSYTEKVRAVSDFLTDSESEGLEQLMHSPLIYQEVQGEDYGSSGKLLVPIENTITSYQRKRVSADKLFNLEIDLQLTTRNIRQGI